MMVMFIEHYLFIPVLLTLTLVQGHTSVVVKTESYTSESKFFSDCASSDFMLHT